MNEFRNCGPIYGVRSDLAGGPPQTMTPGPAPVELAAVEAVANAANDSRPWLDASDLDDHPSATAEHIAYCSPARVLALTKALRIAHEALTFIKQHPCADRACACCNEDGEHSDDALKSISSLVVIR